MGASSYTYVWTEEDTKILVVSPMKKIPQNCLLTKLAVDYPLQPLDGNVPDVLHFLYIYIYCKLWKPG